MRKWMGRVALALIATVAVSACGGSDDKKISTDDGDVTISDDLPDDFPDDFPVYDGADFQGAIEVSDTGQGDGYVATWQTGDDIDDVVSFYEEEFDKGPWKSAGTTNAGGASSFIVTNENNENQGGLLAITEVDGKVQIAATIGESDTPLGGGDGDDDTPESSGGDDGDEDTPEASGDDGGSGDAEIPDEVDLPDGFPTDKFPVDDDATVTSTSSISSGGQSTYFIEVYVEGSADDVAEDYKNKMTDAGWTEALTSTADGAYFLSYTNAESSESVTINVTDAEADGYALVVGSISVAGE